MPGSKYVAVLLSDKDVDTLEEMAEECDATLAAIIRGIIKQHIRDPVLKASTKPARHVNDKKRKSKSKPKSTQGDQDE